MSTGVASVVLTLSAVVSSTGVRSMATRLTVVALPSEVLILTAPAPLLSEVGWNTSPLSAALMLATVPLSVMAASLMPSPLVMVKPAVPLSVRVPCSAHTVTVSEPLSTSATEIVLPLAGLKTTVLSSATTWVGGTVFTGASFTGFTVIVSVSVSDSPPTSVEVMLSWAEPLKLAAA